MTMTKHMPRRLVGALGVVALAGTATTVVTPADAATGTLTYTCTVPFQGPQQFTAAADTDAPARIAYGETVTPEATGTITFPEDVTTTLRDTVGAKKVDGKADVAATVDGGARPWTLAVPQTNVPPKGSLVLVGTGPAGSFEGAKVGSIYDIAVGDFTATINNYQANGSPTTVLPTAVVPCVLNPGQDAAVDTIKVVKDKTDTVVLPKQTRLGAKIKTKVKVTAVHGKKTKGKLKAKLKRNGHKIQTKQVFLRDGKRKINFLRPQRPGDYKIVAKYVGHKNFKGSRGVATFRIG